MVIALVHEMTFLYILTSHWIGDFVFQSRYLADRKSKDFFILLCHVLLYTAAVAVGLALALGTITDPDIGRFLTVNFFAHFITDAITSRITTRLYAGGHIYFLFTTIGFDQLLHTSILYASYYLIFVK